MTMVKRLVDTSEVKRTITHLVVVHRRLVPITSPSYALLWSERASSFNSKYLVEGGAIALVRSPGAVTKRRKKMSVNGNKLLLLQIVVEDNCQVKTPYEERVSALHVGKQAAQKPKQDGM